MYVRGGTARDNRTQSSQQDLLCGKCGEKRIEKHVHRLCRRAIPNHNPLFTPGGFVNGVETSRNTRKLARLVRFFKVVTSSVVSQLLRQKCGKIAVWL